MSRSVPYTEYTALPFSIFLSRIESWHGLAQFGTLDLWYHYNSEIE